MIYTSQERIDMTKKAVLILAYGTPDTIDNMALYLSDISGGRPMSEAFVEEFKHRYSLIGGSPLTRLTYEQAKKTGLELQRRGYDIPVYLGMRQLVAVDSRCNRSNVLTQCRRSCRHCDGPSLLEDEYRQVLGQNRRGTAKHTVQISNSPL